MSQLIHDLLAFFPAWTVLADKWLKHRLGNTYVGASPGPDSLMAFMGDREKRSQSDCSSTAVCVFVPSSHRTYWRVGQAAMNILDKPVWTSAGTSNITKGVLM